MITICYKLILPYYLQLTVNSSEETTHAIHTDLLHSRKVFLPPLAFFFLALPVLVWVATTLHLGPMQFLSLQQQDRSLRRFHNLLLRAMSISNGSAHNMTISNASAYLCNIFQLPESLVQENILFKKTSDALVCMSSWITLSNKWKRTNKAEKGDSECFWHP